MFALTVHQNELVVGGSFRTADSSVSAFFARWGPTCPRGDMNCDNSIDLADVPHFVTVILDPQAASDCQRYVADVATDNNLDALDIPAFTSAILAP